MGMNIFNGFLKPIKKLGLQNFNFINESFSNIHIYFFRNNISNLKIKITAKNINFHKINY